MTVINLMQTTILQYHNLTLCYSILY